MRVIGRGPVIGAAVAVCPLHGRFELVQRVPHGSRVGEPRGLPCRLLAGVDGRTERGTADAAAQGAGGGVAGGRRAGPGLGGRRCHTGPDLGRRYRSSKPAPPGGG